MKVRDTKLLVAHMQHVEMSQARLARHAGRSRQFIHMLVTGEKNTCSREVATRIEEALRVLPTTLFVPQESPAARRPVKPRRKAA